VTDAQAGAFAMAACLNGLTTPERVALTLSMRDSGEVMRWDLPGPVVDKHSTGGLGDCTSLLLAPMLACMGVWNPMISGAAASATPAARSTRWRRSPASSPKSPRPASAQMVADIGCAIVSASGNLAPADKRLYAIRDVTSTVESIDLITASILSKKLAAGLDALVLDVKTGSAAFMETHEDARALARSLVDTANGAGCRTVALLTDMHQPLAPAVGNAVEVAECMEALTGGPLDTPLVELTIDLCATLLLTCGSETDEATARRKLRETLTSGAAAERFGRMVAALGGPLDFTDRWRGHLPQAPVIVDVPAGTSGHVAAIDGRAWAWPSSAWAAAGSRAATPSTPPWASPASPGSGPGWQRATRSSASTPATPPPPRPPAPPSSPPSPSARPRRRAR
jgi:thymidine phosphorylase